MMPGILNPRPFLNTLLGKNVAVSLKWGMKYFGKLVQVDKYMNLALEDVTEIVDGTRSRNATQEKLKSQKCKLMKVI
ncbi:hypothetical protein CDAR_500351 [Caerostris darwini]|uniref:Sm domain-containing protein n=1 Tax=Caerostris darwini TaxID=1538125 RepID=A0AAV4M983_9ARAC|nr:hypothetical protein CDAR_500351 [Caerostris darwini]